MKRKKEMTEEYVVISWNWGTHTSTFHDKKQAELAYMDELQRAHLNHNPEPKMYQRIEPVQDKEE